MVTNPIAKVALAAIAEKQFYDFVKAVVDIERGVMAIAGELHADMEARLLQEGSEQKNLWGVNLYPAASADAWIEFNSLINVRPLQGNRSRGVEDASAREKIVAVVEKLVRA